MRSSIQAATVSTPRRRLDLRGRVVLVVEDHMEYLRERKRLARIPVIAVTALGTHGDLLKTWEAGFNGHLVKPVTFDVVEAQIERVFWAQREAQDA
jgi:DNA-binding response OmpR family regulator